MQDRAQHLIQFLMNHYFHYLFFIIAFANPQLHLHLLGACDPLCLHPWVQVMERQHPARVPRVPCDALWSCKHGRGRSLSGVDDQSSAGMSEATAIYTSCRNARRIFHSCWLEQQKAGRENGLNPNIPDVRKRQLSDSLLLCLALFGASKKSFCLPCLFLQRGRCVARSVCPHGHGASR